MQTFFVEIKCALGRTYEVAAAIAEAEIASEIYSIAGDHDILAKFYVADDVDIGHFVGEKVQVADMGWAAYFRDSEGNVMGLWQSAAR